MTRFSTLVLGLLWALLLPAPLVRAQQTSIEELKKEIQTLTQTMKDMQKDLQEIKILIRGRTPTAAPPPPQNVLLDLANDPSLGERTAKLTLVEFSDYQ